MELNVIVLIAIFIVALVAMFYMPRLMINRAIYSVIRIFRQHDAVTILGAKTVDELDLNPKSFLEKAFRLRDYKPYALQILRNADIIQTTQDGRLYLAENHLVTSRWGNTKN
jgi:hypothetical protein